MHWRVVKSTNGIGKSGFFLPFNFNQGQVSEFDFPEDFPKFWRKVMLNDGNLLCSSYVDKKFYQIKVVSNKCEFVEKKLPFQYCNEDGYRMLFTEDMRVCFQCHYDVQRKLIINVFKSDKNLFDSKPEDVFSFNMSYCPQMPNKVSPLSLLNFMTKNQKYFAILYEDDLKVWCDFLRINDCDYDDVCTLSLHFRIDLSPYLGISTPEDRIMIEEFYDNRKAYELHFNEVESFCLMDCYGLKLVYFTNNNTVLSLPGTEGPCDCILVERSLYGPLIFCGRNYDWYYDVNYQIHLNIYRLNNMTIEKAHSVNFQFFDITHMISYAVLNFQKVAISTFDRLIIADPFANVMLQSFSFVNTFDNIDIVTNAFGAELCIFCQNDAYHEVDSITYVDTEWEKEISLKYLAKRSIFEHYSKEQLDSLNIPKNLKFYLEVY